MTATILQVLRDHFRPEAFGPADSHRIANACQPPHKSIPVKGT